MLPRIVLISDNVVSDASTHASDGSWQKLMNLWLRHMVPLWCCWSSLCCLRKYSILLLVTPLERVLIFSAVILQCDRMVRKGGDVRRLIERRLSQWRDGNFDLLLQEADRCDSGLCSSHGCALKDTDIVRVFSCLILCGKLRTAVHWATECASGKVLLPTTVVNPDAADGPLTVMDVLHQKHPAPLAPVPAALLSCDPLPQLEDVEVTGSHVLLATHCIQGGAGPGGCDAGHWKDALLCFGAHSSQLCDAIASLARRLLNTIAPWDSIQALVANHLIALDKCLGSIQLALGRLSRGLLARWFAWLPEWMLSLFVTLTNSAVG